MATSTPDSTTATAGVPRIVPAAWHASNRNKGKVRIMYDDVTLEEMATKVEIASVLTPGVEPDWGEWSGNAWSVTLTYDGRKLTVPFFMGSGLVTRGGRWPGRPIAPTAMDVLECLLSDAQAGESTFHDFCEDFGYDEDSRSAEKLWHSCQNTLIEMRKLLGADYDTFMDAER